MKELKWINEITEINIKKIKELLEIILSKIKLDYNIPNFLIFKIDKKEFDEIGISTEMNEGSNNYNEAEHLIRVINVNVTPLPEIKTTYLPFNVSFKVENNDAPKKIQEVLEYINERAKKNNEKSVNKTIEYNYLENPEPTGILKIMGKSLEFDKIPAKIINYFYRNSSAGNDYKKYKDFNSSTEGELTSDLFNKKIGDINERIIRDTKFSKTLIESGSAKPPKAKMFRWNNLI